MIEQRDPQLLKGVLPMLVLALVTERESYGYELVTRLRDQGLEDIAAGTVYPVLARLEREGHLASRLVASSSGPARKYYLPTAAGSAELRRAELAWSRLAATVATTLVRARPATTTGTAALPQPALPHPAPTGSAPTTSEDLS